MLWAALIAAGMLVVPFSAGAAEAPFEIAHQENLKGDITLIGNTSMTCPASSGSCAGAQSGDPRHNG